MRPIDADALISELEKDEKLFDKEAEDALDNPLAYTEGYSTAMWSRANGIRDAIVEIHDAPTINDTEAKPTEWIMKYWCHGHNDGIDLICPKCEKSLGIMRYGIEWYKYCPFCGRRMKG